MKTQESNEKVADEKVSTDKGQSRHISRAFSLFFNRLKSSDKTNYFQNWYDAQPPSAKVGFFAAVILAFLTHIIAYSTLMFEEHMPGFTPPSWAELFEIEVVQDRYFHGFANSLSFHYMNWFVGALQVLFLSLIVFFVIKSFNIKNKLFAVLIAGILVTFPTIAETNLFYHDAAPYYFAALLSFLAFFITMRYRFGWLIGAFFITLSLAIYQSKISVAMVAIIIHLIIYILDKNPRVIDTIKYASRYLFTIVIGGLAYYLSLQFLNVTHVNVRRVDQMFSLENVFAMIIDIPRSTYWTWQYFFSTTNDTFRDFRIPSDLLMFSYALIFITSFVLLLMIMILRAKNLSNKIAVIFLILILPIAGNFTSLFNDYTPLLTMTTYQFAFYLILPLFLWDNFKINTYGLKKIICVVLVFVIGYYISFSNFIYLRGEVLTIHATQFANRVTARMEPLLPYSEDNQVFIHGNLTVNPIYPVSTLFQEYSPRGLRNEINLGGRGLVGGWWRDIFTNVIRYRVGVDINHAGGSERRQELLDYAISDGMPVYPQEGSIALVDGVVVAIVSFFGRVDIIDVDTNSIAAIISHTGKSTELEFEYTWYLYRDGERLEQIYVDSDGVGEIKHSINSAGSYQLRVFVRLSDGRNALNTFSDTFEVATDYFPP